MSTIAAPETTVKRHPLRGAFYGMMLGISGAIYAVLFAVVPFEWVTLAGIVVAGAVVGMLWGGLAPAKKNTQSPTMATSLSPTFTRTQEDEGPLPTYEETFGAPSEAPPVPVNDGSGFGLPVAQD